MWMVAVGSTASLLGPLDYMFGETLRVAIVVAVFLAGVIAVAARFNAWPLERALRNWLVVTSLVTIWLFTQHNPYPGSGRAVELHPFVDLRVAVDQAGRYRDIVIANIALFVPLGVALGWTGKRFLRAVGIGAAVSVLAEVVQYVSNHGRVSQSGDVLINVAGLVIGWGLFVAFTGGWGPLQRTPAQRTGSESERKTREFRTSSAGRG